MAIATLSIDVEARLASLEAGLNKAVSLADRAGNQLNAAFAGAGAFVMTAAVAAASQQLATLITDAVDVTGAMKDMQESFGATADGLSQIRAGAALGGKTIGDMEGPLNKLAKALDAAGDATSDEARALKALGLDVQKLKSMSPDEVFIEVAKASQNYADGVGKAAVMTALFGKEGAKLIPTLNDIAEVGTNYVRVTQAQIDAADKFDKSVKRLAAGFADFKVAAGNNIIPALNEIIEFTKRAQKEYGTFLGLLVGGIGGGGAKLLGIDLDELKRAETQVSDTFSKLAKSRQELADQKALKASGLGLGFVIDGNIKAAEADVAKYSGALKAAIKDRDALIAAQKNGGAPKAAPVEFSASVPKAAAVKSPKVAADKSDPLGDWLKDLEAQIKPAEDAIARLRDIQLDAAVSGAELTRSERALYDVVNAPGWANLSEDWQDMVRTQFELANATEKTAVEAARLKALLAATDSAQLEKTRADMQLLADAFEAGKISAEQFEEAASKALGNVADKGKDDFAQLLDAIEGWGRDASKAIASTVFEGEMSLKSFGKILDQIAQQIFAMILQKQIMDPLMKSIGGAIGGAAGGAAGGAKTGGASSPTLFDGLLAMGGKFIGSFDVGTPYVPATGLALIHKGERIVTAADNAAGNFGAGNVTNNFTISGNVDRRTQQQISAAAGAGVRRALARSS